MTAVSKVTEDASKHLCVYSIEQNLSLNLYHLLDPICIRRILSG